MKKTKLVLLSSLAFTVGFACSLSPVSANTSSQINQNTNEIANSVDEFHQIDKYVVVQNNSFVLNIPDGVNISKDLIRKTEEQIKLSNTRIAENNLVIDPVTRTAHTATVTPRSWGKNDMQFGWNYVRVYIDAGNLRLILVGGIGAVGGALTTLATTVGMAAAIGAVTAILGLKASQVNDGIWFDYNFFLHKVTAASFQ